MANEKRLIDANELVERLKFKRKNSEVGLHRGLQSAMTQVMKVPTVDAVEVVHGRWLSVGDSLFPGTQEKCSLCGFRKGVGYVYHYCPNCGAKMEGAEDGK